MTNTNKESQSIPIIQVDDTAYRTKDFPSFESFYKNSPFSVIVFSIDGADWIEYGENVENPTNKATTTHERFLHHFLSQFGCSEISLLVGCYEGRKEYSYAVSIEHFYGFVKKLGYVTEQHSYLLLEVADMIEANAGVFGTNRAPQIELIENNIARTGDTIATYSRIGLLSADLDTCLGWTYCNRSETFYELVK